MLAILNLYSVGAASKLNLGQSGCMTGARFISVSLRATINRGNL